MKKILITGASGFIGTNLLEHFLNKNYEVLNIDLVKPKNESHFKYWTKANICDFENFKTLSFTSLTSLHFYSQFIYRPMFFD